MNDQIIKNERGKRKEKEKNERGEGKNKKMWCEFLHGAFFCDIYLLLLQINFSDHLQQVISNLQMNWVFEITRFSNNQIQRHRNVCKN